MSKQNGSYRFRTGSTTLNSLSNHALCWSFITGFAILGLSHAFTVTDSPSVLILRVSIIQVANQFKCILFTLVRWCAKTIKITCAMSNHRQFTIYVFIFTLYIVIKEEEHSSSCRNVTHSVQRIFEYCYVTHTFACRGFYRKPEWDLSRHLFSLDPGSVKLKRSPAPNVAETLL